MSCNCLEHIKEQLEERHDAPVELKTVDTLTLVNDKYQAIFYPGVLEYTFRARKVDGTPGKSKTKRRVYFRVCPFCGVPYREEVGEKARVLVASPCRCTIPNPRHCPVRLTRYEARCAFTCPLTRMQRTRIVLNGRGCDSLPLASSRIG